MLPLKDRLLALYTKKVAQSKQPPRLHIGFQKANVIGLLYSYENAAKQAAVLRFAKEIQGTDTQLAILCYTTAKDKVHAIPCFTQQAISPLGRVVNKQVHDFVHTPFDYLYHVDLVSNAMLNYILALSKAKCRMGHFDPLRMHLFEIMVKFNRRLGISETDSLIAQMLHYTKLLAIK